jgi:hypothetical protein
MSATTKLGVAVPFVLALAAGGAFQTHRRLLEAEKEKRVLAQRALMGSEELVWTLEGLCLKDALRVLGREDAKKIAEGASSPEAAQRVETRLREYLRIRRSSDVWKAAERAFVTMTDGSRDATNEAAIKTGLRPVDILSEWMTVDGVLDARLMDKVWNDRASLKASLGGVVDTFFPEGTTAPDPARGVTVRHREDTWIELDVFGGLVKEECSPVAGAAAEGGRVNVRWTSNYNFLRAFVHGEAHPKTEDEETLVPTEEGYGVDYKSELAEYLEGVAKRPWATLLCQKGALVAADALDAGSEAGGTRAPEEKKPDEEKKPETPR